MVELLKFIIYIKLFSEVINQKINVRVNKSSLNKIKSLQLLFYRHLHRYPP